MTSLRRIVARGMAAAMRMAAARGMAVAFILFLAFTGSPVAAQELSPGLKHDIDSLYQTFAEENHLPGIAYGIIIDTSLTYDGATGYSNLADSTPVTVSTAFRAASMTKSFTALAILRLRDEGKLKLDDPVSLWLPELDSLRYLTDDAPVLTIRHLLTHTGGFPQDDPWADRQLETTEEKLDELIRNGLSMSNVPGVTYEYSNLGYTLLGKIIRAVTGESFQEYIDSVVFQPLGMNSTVWEYGDLPEGLMAKGYRYLHGGWSQEELLHDGSFGAMGGLITTVEDFARYAVMHLSAWPPRNSEEGLSTCDDAMHLSPPDGVGNKPDYDDKEEIPPRSSAEESLEAEYAEGRPAQSSAEESLEAEYAEGRPAQSGAEESLEAEYTEGRPAQSGAERMPLKRSSLREMHCPSSGVAFNSSTLYPGGQECNVIVAYGYGLRWSLDCMNRKKIFHNGGLPGFGSNWTIMPGYGIGVVAFSNRTYGSTYNVNQKVLELLIASLELKPHKPELTDILQTRMNDLLRIMPEWDTADTGDIFSDNFFIDYLPEDLRAETAGVFRLAGRITDVRELIPENSLRGSFDMEGVSGTVTVTFTLTPESDPRIQSFRITYTPKNR